LNANGHERLLVIDADISKRVATELSNRARRAVSAYQLDLATNVQDPELLVALAEQFGDAVPWVLVTGDDTMPAEHGPVIHETQATVATIHPDYPDTMTEHAWRFDVIHRWAHAMQAQPPGSVRRYAANGSGVWKPRRRHLRRIAKEGWQPWRPPPAPAEGVSPHPPPEAPRLPGAEWG
jgi:hypothetical protein